MACFSIWVIKREIKTPLKIALGFLKKEEKEPSGKAFQKVLGGVHKLHLQDLAFFDHLPPLVYIFYGIKVYKKSISLITYP